MKFELPELGYEYNDLEPFIDEETMKLHHQKHHQAYLNKFNAAIENKFEGKEAEEIVANWKEAPEDVRQAIRNHGGGYINHALFWKILKKDVPFEGEVAEAIKEKWGSYESFKEEFAKAAASQFGSGWAWLVLNEGELEILSTPNQDTPLANGKKPILAIDVWEHAYYLNYRNRRPEYIDAFFNVINWKEVNRLYKGE